MTTETKLILTPKQLTKLQEAQDYYRETVNRIFKICKDFRDENSKGVLSAAFLYSRAKYFLEEQYHSRTVYQICESGHRAMYKKRINLADTSGITPLAWKLDKPLGLVEAIKIPYLGEYIFFETPMEIGLIPKLEVNSRYATISNLATIRKVRTDAAEVAKTATTGLTARAKAFVKAYNDVAKKYRKWVMCKNKYLQDNPDFCEALNKFVDAMVEDFCPEANDLKYFKLNSLPFATYMEDLERLLDYKDKLSDKFFIMNLVSGKSKVEVIRSYDICSRFMRELRDIEEELLDLKTQTIEELKSHMKDRVIPPELRDKIGKPYGDYYVRKTISREELDAHINKILACPLKEVKEDPPNREDQGSLVIPAGDKIACPDPKSCCHPDTATLSPVPETPATAADCETNCQLVRS